MSPDMNQAPGSADSCIELRSEDLNENGGVFCPNPKAQMQLWNGHPRVFLEIAKSGQARCPYCGTLYRLKEGEVFLGH